MSIDFNLFYNSSFTFSAEDLDAYASKFGIGMKFHPDCDIRTRKDAVPVRLETSAFSADGETKAYLTGFESYPSAYEHPQIDEVPVAQRKKKKSFLRRLFSRKKAEIPPLHVDEFDFFVQNCDRTFFLCSRSDDPLGILAVYIFGAYFCRNAGAVFDNPQIGCFYRDPDKLEEIIPNLIEEFKSAAANGQLPLTEFTEWGELPAEKPVIRE